MKIQTVLTIVMIFALAWGWEPRVCAEETMSMQELKTRFLSETGEKWDDVDWTARRDFMQKVRAEKRNALFVKRQQIIEERKKSFHYRAIIPLSVRAGFKAAMGKEWEDGTERERSQYMKQVERENKTKLRDLKRREKEKQKMLSDYIKEQAMQQKAWEREKRQKEREEQRREKELKREREAAQRELDRMKKEALRRRKAAQRERK